MKSYKEFALAESTLADDERSDINKLGAALVEAERLLKRIAELGNRLYKASGKYSGQSNSKLAAILRMMEKPEEIAKNGALMKQRLEQLASGVEKK